MLTQPEDANTRHPAGEGTKGLEGGHDLPQPHSRSRSPSGLELGHAFPCLQGEGLSQSPGDLVECGLWFRSAAVGFEPGSLTLV